VGAPDGIICWISGTPPEKEQEPIQTVKTDKRDKNEEGDSDPVELVLCHAAMLSGPRVGGNRKFPKTGLSRRLICSKPRGQIMRVSGGGALPPDLEIAHSSFFPSAGWVGKVEVFEFDGIGAAAFLCHVPGDFGYSQTVVAMEGF
jgi:hypothetical protein